MKLNQDSISAQEVRKFPPLPLSLRPVTKILCCIENKLRDGGMDNNEVKVKRDGGMKTEEERREIDGKNVVWSRVSDPH
jgi:hypothetical protein